MDLLASAEPLAKPGMPRHPAPSRILEIGCGTGVLTEMLADVFPSAEVDAVDVSPAMTIKARAYLSGNRIINWIVQDACNLSENIKYPLIISNCALHWITPIEMIIGKLGAMLEQNGKLVFAIMLRGTLGELNSARQRITPHKPPRIILPGASDVRQAVKKAGLKITSEKTETIRNVYASPEQMLRQFHDQGLTGGNIPHHKLLLTRSEISSLIADYSKNYKCKKDGKSVYASYRVFYCVAVKRAGTINSTKTRGCHSRQSAAD